MKTLQLLTIVFAFTALAMAPNANAHNVTSYEVQKGTDLKTTIKKMVKNDFRKYNNYFYKNDIDRLKEDVVVLFYVNHENKIQVKSTSCKNCFASEYVQQLLQDAKVNVDKSMTNRMLRIELKLDYRT